MAASWAFLPGYKAAMSSSVSIVSILSISSVFDGVSKAAFGTVYCFFLAALLYLSTIFLAFIFDAKFDFFKSVESISDVIKWPVSAGILISFFF